MDTTEYKIMYEKYIEEIEKTRTLLNRLHRVLPVICENLDNLKHIDVFNSVISNMIGKPFDIRDYNIKELETMVKPYDKKCADRIFNQIVMMTRVDCEELAKNYKIIPVIEELVEEYVLNKYKTKYTYNDYKSVYDIIHIYNNIEDIINACINIKLLRCIEVNNDKE